MTEDLFRTEIEHMHRLRASLAQRQAAETQTVREAVQAITDGDCMIDGDMDAGAWSCGMVVGLIHDIPTVAELIDRIMADAERLIRNRLVGLLGRDEMPAMKVA